MLTFLFLFDIDWSAEQLDKHYREIKDQLGNYFMRIASPILVKRSQGGEGPIPESLRWEFMEDALSTSGLPDLTVVEADSPDWNAILLRHTLALKEKVDKNMDELEAGNALVEIMAVLKVVSTIPFPFSRVFIGYSRMLMYPSFNRRTKHSMKLNLGLPVNLLS